MHIHVPASAAIEINDHATRQRGSWRQFVTPPLPGNRQLVYEVKAIWTECGQTMTQSRPIRVAPGDRLTIDFLTPMEENVSTLPVSRTVGQP
jgi:uncharacterized protein (TIGR03000 family)